MNKNQDILDAIKLYKEYEISQSTISSDISQSTIISSSKPISWIVRDEDKEIVEKEIDKLVIIKS